MIPEQIETKDGCVQIKVLPWLQYIALRIKRHGLGYLFKRTSAGYPRIFSLGYYSRKHGEIVLAKVGNYQLRYLHELGHANGLVHVWIEGDVMNPYGFFRGYKYHTCTYSDVNEGYKCGHKHGLSEECYRKGIGWCHYLKVEYIK